MYRNTPDKPIDQQEEFLAKAVLFLKVKIRREANNGNHELREPACRLLDAYTAFTQVSLQAVRPAAFDGLDLAVQGLYKCSPDSTCNDYTVCYIDIQLLLNQ